MISGERERSEDRERSEGNEWEQRVKTKGVRTKGDADSTKWRDDKWKHTPDGAEKLGLKGGKEEIKKWL